MIYRDLKPENVLLDADGHVKLADMGLAKYLAGEKLVLSQGAGTREYMAPEMFSSIGHGKPVDWWALGILVYEMFSFSRACYIRKFVFLARNPCKFAYMWSGIYSSRILNVIGIYMLFHIFGEARFSAVSTPIFASK